MKPLIELYPLLNNPQKLVVTMHQKPDADAMGSALGLYHFLLQLGHEVVVISPTNWAGFLNWMPGADKMIDFEKDTEKATAQVELAQFIFCLDFNTLSRTKRMEECLNIAKGIRVLIDHHQEPQTEKFAYGKSDTGKSSTAEMVFDFMIESGKEEYISQEVSQCLYAGVMTDTGSFRFPSTTASVHRMVAYLKEKGLDHSRIHEALFDNFSESRLRFIGHVLLNRMEVFFEYNTALITVPQSDLLKYEIKTGDTEGLVNYPLSIEGIRLVAIVIDRGEERKWSFRSKGNFDVNVFARKYFNGGGHKNAAGGGSKDNLESTVQHFKVAMRENKEQLSTYQF